MVESPVNHTVGRAEIVVAAVARIKVNRRYILTLSEETASEQKEELKALVAI